MFLQVINGRTSDPAGVRTMMDRWVTELSAGAQGWLGTTAGVTDDGQFVAAARFASAEDAQHNSDRPEQGAWFAELTKHLDGDPTFANSSEVRTMLDGGSDEAGFVQVIQSRVVDGDRVREAADAMDQMGEAFSRPDLIGGIGAISDDGQAMTQVMYFTSEEEARKGEASEPPPEFVEAMGVWQGATANEQYLDLRDPWMTSPA